MTDARRNEGSAKLTTYTSESQLTNPRQFFALMIADVVACGPLAWRLAMRNIRARYRRSRLGYLWAVLPIVVTTVVWVTLSASGVLAVRATGIPYVAFVLVNVTLWQGFIDALFGPLRQADAARSMLTSVNFARESLILASIIEVLFTFVIRLVLLVIGLLVLDVSLPATIVLAPLAILVLVLFGTTLGLLLLPVSLLYEDIQRSLVIATGLWLFVTPVVYPLPSTGPLAVITSLNPVTPLLVTARELLTTGVLSRPGGFLTVSVATLLLLAGACVLYRIAIPHLIARLSS